MLRRGHGRVLWVHLKEVVAKVESKHTGEWPPTSHPSMRNTGAARGSRSRNLDELREAASTCKACDLWKRATQTVFGEGMKTARIMMIGEQPGDREDIRGRPFVGPAGAILDKALAAAGIDRQDVYVTNIVKHFKWEPRGKRRIHKKPNAVEISACRPWLDAEIEAVKPEVIVLLGATAAQALLGRSFLVTRHRGEWVQSAMEAGVTATVHPSSILRAPDDEARHTAMREFIEDLKIVSERTLHKRAA